MNIRFVYCIETGVERQLCSWKGERVYIFSTAEYFNELDDWWAEFDSFDIFNGTLESIKILFFFYS